jgi:hypothetical protein
MSRDINFDNSLVDETYDEVLREALVRMQNTDTHDAVIRAIKYLINSLSQPSNLGVIFEFKHWAKEEFGIEKHLKQFGLTLNEIYVVAKEIKRRLREQLQESEQEK